MPQKQATEGVTYAHKIEKHEAAIDWTLPAHTLVQRVRAFNPFPGASASVQGEVVKVWAAHVGDELPSGQSPSPGMIVAVTPAGIAVAAIDFVVILTELQRPGGKRLPVADFLRGFALQAGMHCDMPSGGVASST